MGNHSENVTIGVKGNISDFDKSMKKLQGNMANVSKTAGTIAKVSGAVFVALSAGIGVALTSFSKFQDSMLGVKTLLTDKSFSDVGKSLDEGFRQMSEDTLKVFGQIPIELDKATKGMFDLVSAGVPASKATKTLAIAGKLAVAGLTDVSVAVDGLTSVMNAYGKDASEAEVLSGKFFLAQQAGKTTIAELSSGFGQVGSSAAALGISFEEVLGTISAVSLAGVKTSEAYTGLKAVISGIAKPTAEASAEAERLGIAFGPKAIEEAGGFEAFLNKLKNSSGFTKESLVKLFGSVEAVNTMFALTGSQAKSFGNILKNLNNDTLAAETIQKAYETQVASLKNQFKLLTNRFQKISIEIGARLEPIFSKLVAVGHMLLDVWDNLSEGTKDTAVAMGFFGTIIAGITTVIAGLLAVLPSIIAGFLAVKSALATILAYKAVIAVLSTIGAVISSVGIIIAAAIAAIVGLFVAWHKNFLGIQEVTAGVLAVIEAAWDSVFGGMGEKVDDFAEITKGAWIDLKDHAQIAIDGVVGIFTGMFQFVVDGFNFLKEQIINVFDTLAPLIEKVFGLDEGTIKSQLQNVVDGAQEQMDSVIAIYEKGRDEKLKIIKEEETEKAKIEKKEAAKKAKENKKEDKKNYDAEIQAEKDLQAEITGIALKAQIEADQLTMQLRMEAADREKQAHAEKWEQIGDVMQTTMNSGMQGLIGDSLGALTNMFLPGMGGAVSDMFNMLAGDSDTFIKQFTEMFSSEFLNNITDNIAILIEKLPEIIPPFIQALIEASPRIAAALIKAVTDPNFIKSFAIAISYAVVEGIITALKQTRDRIAQAFSFSNPKWLQDFINTASNLFKTPGWLQRFIDAVNRLTNWSFGGGGELGKFTSTFSGLSKAFYNKGKSPDVKYLQQGFTPRGMDRIPAMIDPRERLLSHIDNQTLIRTMNDIKNAVSNGQNINLMFSGDGIQEFIERSLVSATALGTGRIDIAVGSET